MIILTKVCVLPTPGENGVVSVTKGAVVKLDGVLSLIPLQIEYTCNEGYSTDPAAETVLNCDGSSGNFQPAIPDCIRSKYCISVVHISIKFVKKL